MSEDKNTQALDSGSERPIAIEAKGLRKSYKVGDITVEAVKSVDVTLYAGELTLLMGPSGSGKSTLASMLGALLSPDEGTITAMGQDLTNMSRKKLDKFRLDYSGFIFQTVNLFKSLSATDQILYALSHTGIGGKKAREIAAKSLEEVRMSDRAHLRPQQMSGGENQRVAIARALSMDPKLIIADEPTSALDGGTGQVVTDLLKTAAKTHGAMVMCVTHDERLQNYADRILRMEDGVMISDERPNSKSTHKAAE